jgi:hypothetical protein
MDTKNYDFFDKYTFPKKTGLMRELKILKLKCKAKIRLSQNPFFFIKDTFKI